MIHENTFENIHETVSFNIIPIYIYTYNIYMLGMIHHAISKKMLDGYFLHRTNDGLFIIISIWYLLGFISIFKVASNCADRLLWGISAARCFVVLTKKSKGSFNYKTNKMTFSFIFRIRMCRHPHFPFLWLPITVILSHLDIFLLVVVADACIRKAVTLCKWKYCFKYMDFWNFYQKQIFTFVHF